MNDNFKGWKAFAGLLFSMPHLGKRLIVGFALTAVFIYPSRAGIIKADFEPEMPSNSESTAETILMGIPVVKNSKAKIRKIWITAYSSTPEQTDDTPFETALGTSVRDGIIAANFLPFGTKVKIPSMFGDKIFVVEDRMHSKYNDRIDIWMSDTEDALRFGKRHLEIAILN